VNVDPKSIKSGTYIAVNTWDGLSTLIMLGTGGRTSHTAMAVWEGDQLYVVESTDSDPTGGYYWPPPYGVIRNTWANWLKFAKNATYQVNLAVLKPEWQAKFDEKKFWDYFSTIEGMPYGYQTFVYTFLDTYPVKNLPLPMDDDVANWLISGFDRILPNDTGEVSVYRIFTEGLNKRLNVTCPNIACISRNLLRMGWNSLTRVSEITDNDEWRFDVAQNYSMTCSQFVGRAYQKAFGSAWPADFSGNEQTPKDNYQMALFDANYWTHANCPIGLSHDTGNGQTCQLMGKHKMPLNDFNTVPIYAGMNNHCPSQWPGFFRCPASNLACC